MGSVLYRFAKGELIDRKTVDLLKSRHEYQFARDSIGALQSPPTPAFTFF
jgi:hypothetical protein